MKKILILIDQIKPAHQMLSDAIQTEVGDSGSVLLSTFSNVFFHLQKGRVDVSVEGIDISSFDLVYFRRGGSKYMSMCHTLALILERLNIPFFDKAFSEQGPSGDKFKSLARLALANLPVIDSFYAGSKALAQFEAKVEESLSYPFVAKDRYVQRGKGVWLIKDRTSFEKLFSNSNKQLILQKFIKSKQEFRLLVLGNKVSVFEQKIQNDPNEFRANVALGANEKFLSISDLPQDLSDIAVKAAQTLNLQVAGVDVMEDFEGNYWLLEVNRGPGLTYDSSVSPELTEFGKFFAREIK